MSDIETEKVNCVESSPNPSDSEVSSSSDLPDTPPPSRSGSDASSHGSPAASFVQTDTTTNEFEATSVSQSTTLHQPCTSNDSDSDLSDPDQCNYEKDLQWNHLDQVPDEVNSTQADTSSTQSTNDSEQSSDNQEQTEEEKDDEENAENVDEEVEDTDEDAEDADDEEEDVSDSDTCSEKHYVYLVPTRSQNEYPPLLTFLFFLFLFLHLMHYMLLLKDSQTNQCFPFRY